MLLRSWITELVGRLAFRSVRRPQQRRRLRRVPIEALECRAMLSGMTITVNTTSDAATDSNINGPTVTLREAINFANADTGVSDTITFASSLISSGPATITLNGTELLITNSMTITGSGASQLAIDGNNASRIFDLNGTTSDIVTITGLTLQHGNAISGNYGGAIYNNETLTVSHDTISASSAGGGVFSSGSVISSYNTIYGNNGSGILNFGGSFISTYDTISTNSANGGGGIDNNSGIFAATNDTISGNSAVYGGSGIVNVYGTFTSRNNTISGNFADSNIGGGGIANYHGTFTSTNDTISGNFAENFTQPANELGAGGIYNNNDGTFISTNDTISGNATTASGGGIYNDGGTYTSTNDTISANIAGERNGYGGGVYNAGTFTLTNDTIAGNSNVGIANPFGTIAVLNSIVLGNSAPGDPEITGTITANSAGNVTTGLLASVLQTVPGNLQKPLLQNNGGPTQTIALVVGSPAIGAALTLGNVTATGDGGSTAVAVDNVTFIAAGDYLKIGSEIVLVQGVTAGSGTTGTLTVARHQNGTSQGTLSGLPISLALDQRGSLRSTNDIGSVEVHAPSITSAPSITAQPSSTTVTAGTTASFTASASGTPTPTVQWQVSTDGGSTWSNISGATSTTYSFTTASGNSGSQYRAVFTNALGTATTNAATLTVSAVTANVTSTSVQWGTSGSAALVNASGGRLLPTGRTNDIDWFNIKSITVTLDRSIPSLAPSDVSVIGSVGGSYGPVAVSGSGTTWVITLAKVIANADKVIVTIGNSQLTSYQRELDVLPGDFNDDGVVSSADVTLLNNATVAPYNVFADLNGDGVIDINDGKLARSKIGTKRIL